MDATQRFNLKNKTAIVTGASQGIGRSIAIALAQHGADVGIIDITSQKKAQPVLDKITAQGRRAWFFQQDLALTHGLTTAGDDIWNETGQVDILVNNAGVAYMEHFNQISIEHWRHIMSVNVDAVFFLSQAIAGHMIKHKIAGRIINTSSVNGLVAEAGLAHYNASKGAVEMITKSLAVELGTYGITANTICPGMIETEIGDEFPLAEGFQDHFSQHIPLQHRLGTAEDCAGAVVFLASPAGKYITGQHIIIDGGIICEQVPRLDYMPPTTS
tara:strand:+ start:612 stop:1427 length:816 start_codon:yes stop_codon:yes gene_type:complete